MVQKVLVSCTIDIPPNVGEVAAESLRVIKESRKRGLVDNGQMNNGQARCLSDEPKLELSLGRNNQK